MHPNPIHNMLDPLRGVERTPAGKVRVYVIETGECLERWSVDVREMLSRAPDVYTVTPPTTKPKERT